MRFRAKLGLLGLLGPLGLAALAWGAEVDNDLTAEDREYLPKILGEGARTLAETTSIAGELAAIRAVQNAVLSAAPKNQGLPQGSSREPKALFERKVGLCYDRSRVIEKGLRLLGFTTRHVFIYSTDGGESFPLLVPGIPSHAVTEVQTRGGWMVVDSNARWVAETAPGQVADMATIRADVGNAHLQWAGDQAVISEIYRRPFNYWYGLYSRHGKFYPPYLPIPDLNWSEVYYNVAP